MSKKEGEDKVQSKYLDQNNISTKKKSFDKKKLILNRIF